MSEQAINEWVLEEADFDALEELLVSEVVPEDCMNLEMLDGYLAAVVSAPIRIERSRWLPAVWSAHADEASFEAGTRMQKVIHLVLAYYNEMAATLGDPEGWQPFCYASQEGDGIAVGEEWVEGFAQGLELWPSDWEVTVGHEAATRVRAVLDGVLDAWQEQGSMVAASDEARMEWLDQVRDQLGEVMNTWRNQNLEVAAPAELPALAGQVRGSSVGRNDPCPCGSGKKFKKCCGAE